MQISPFDDDIVDSVGDVSQSGSKGIDPNTVPSETVVHDSPSLPNPMSTLSDSPPPSSSNHMDPIEPTPMGRGH